nr:Tad domain-containing protein [Dietzia maris]
MAVVVAILMVPLMGFAAISLDIAATHAEKQQLQNGSDAAALAIAQDCARHACDDPLATAEEFVLANSNSGDAKARLPHNVNETTGRVTVESSAVREHWFAPVFGVDSTELKTRSSAAWGSPTGGTAVLPLILPLCEVKKHIDDFDRPTGEEQIIITKPVSCPPNGGIHNLPGGFGWLQADPGSDCNVTTRIDDEADSQPGNRVHKCDLSPIRNRTILVPIFDESHPENVDGGGKNGTYVVHGYAAFHVTGYYFSNQKWGEVNCSDGLEDSDFEKGNSLRCIRGYFTELHLTDPNFEYGPDAPNLGASAVYLLPD